MWPCNRMQMANPLCSRPWAVVEKQAGGAIHSINYFHCYSCLLYNTGQQGLA